MTAPTRRWCGIALLLCCFGFAAPAGAVDLVGKGVAYFEWPPASGPVAYYRVEVNYNDQGFRPGLLTTPASTPKGGVIGKYGDTVQIRVQAVGWSNETSGFSEPSEIVRFVDPATQPPPAEDPPAEDPPAEDPPAEDPPAEDPPAEDPPAEDPPAEDPPLGDPADLLDFNADGRADLLTRSSYTSNTKLWLITGSEVTPVQVEPVSRRLKIVGNADYDGDGYADLLAHDPETGSLEIRLLENGQTVETGRFQIGEAWDVVGSADYDGNGYADFLLRNEETRDLQLWSLYGTDVLEIVPFEGLPDAYAEILGSGDYDGDGRHDILWQDDGNYYGSDLFVWYLDDPTNPVEEEIPGVGWGWQVVGTGDYDGDGTSDVLLREDRTGDLEMYLFGPSSVSERGIRDYSGRFPSWSRYRYSVVGSADFNGDGRCDIALRHRYGDVLLLYMDGYQATSGLVLDDVPESLEGVGLESVGFDESPEDDD